MNIIESRTIVNQTQIDFDLADLAFHGFLLDLANDTTNKQIFARTKDLGAADFNSVVGDYEWGLTGVGSNKTLIKEGVKLADAVALFPKLSNSPPPNGGRLLSALLIGKPHALNKCQINFTSSGEFNDYGGAFGTVIGAGVRDAWVPIVAIRFFVTGGVMNGNILHSGA